MAMTIVAKAVKGREFLYNPRSAHEVSKAGAEYIARALNEHNYHLKEGEVWHVFTISEHDHIAYVYANGQSFKRRKGTISEYSIC